MKEKAVKRPVSSKTLVVGIDIAKHIHWVQVMFNGELIGKAFSVHNNKESFVNLVKTLNTRKHHIGANNVVIGMEHTGHYFRMSGGRGY